MSDTRPCRGCSTPTVPFWSFCSACRDRLPISMQDALKARGKAKEAAVTAAAQWLVDNPVDAS